jgi:hypothetical protein
MRSLVSGSFRPSLVWTRAWSWSLPDTGDASWLTARAGSSEPLLVRRSDRPRRVELAFHRPQWSEDDLAHLLQAVVLSPYRDLTSPASVVRQAELVTVHLGLGHPGAEQHVRHVLEQVISELGTPAAESRGKALHED